MELVLLELPEPAVKKPINHRKTIAIRINLIPPINSRKIFFSDIDGLMKQFSLFEGT